jgi:hypothetical protein
MRRIVTLATIIAALSATPCRAACHTDHFNFFYGSDASTTMRATTGARCTMKFFLGGSLKAIEVTERPKHGSASYNGSIGYPEVAYQPSPGYKGDDAFAFSIEGQDKHRSGVSTIRVSVDVK